MLYLLYSLGHHSDRVEGDCIKAFQNGQKNSAEQLLPHVESPDSVTTAFSFRASTVSNVSLLHLAANNGWNDIAALLVTRYHCNANGTDANGNTPMHYATYNGHLEVVKYFIKELLCKPMGQEQPRQHTTSLCLCQWPWPCGAIPIIYW